MTDLIRSDRQPLRIRLGDMVTSNESFGARGSLIFRPSNSSMVVVPTSHAPMPKLADVVSNKSLSCL